MFGFFHIAQAYCPKSSQLTDWMFGLQIVKKCPTQFPKAQSNILKMFVLSDQDWSDKVQTSNTFSLSLRKINNSN